MSHPLWWQHNSSLVFWTPAFTWTQQFKIIQIMYMFKDYKTKPCHVMWLVMVVLLKIEQPSLLSSLPYHLKKTAMFCRKALAMDPFSSTFMNRCFYIRAPRATGAQRPSPAGSECTAIALDMGQAHLWYENNTMQTIHAIQTLRTVCGFLDMGDGCCLIFNKNQLMFIVRKSITAQIKRKIILFFS